jgi:glutathione S-transferase
VPSAAGSLIPYSALPNFKPKDAVMSTMKLWGFNGSTYVRTVKMLLAEKGATDFEQVPVNVLAGEPKQPEHLARHPFGKVPVLDHNGMRILETSAIVRYLNDVLPGKSLVPGTPEDRARMDMVIGLLDSYGYGAMVGGVAAYHLFPDFVGGKNDAMREAGLANGRKVLEICTWRPSSTTCLSRRTLQPCLISPALLTGGPGCRHSRAFRLHSRDAFATAVSLQLS